MNYQSNYISNIRASSTSDNTIGTSVFVAKYVIPEMLSQSISIFNNSINLEIVIVATNDARLKHLIESLLNELKADFIIKENHNFRNICLSSLTHENHDLFAKYVFVLRSANKIIQINGNEKPLPEKLYSYKDSDPMILEAFNFFKHLQVYEAYIPKFNIKDPISSKSNNLVCIESSKILLELIASNFDDSFYSKVVIYYRNLYQNVKYSSNSYLKRPIFKIIRFIHRKLFTAKIKRTFY